MAKRDNRTQRTNTGATTTTTSSATATDATQQAVVAFADSLVAIAGLVQAKAEGWLDQKR